MLITVAHGTRCATGQVQVRRLVEAIRRRRPGLEVKLAYLDIEQPHLRTVAARLRRPAVAVPLLFAAGYHVRADIPQALRGSLVAAAPPLGPDPALTDALIARLAAAGGRSSRVPGVRHQGTRVPSRGRTHQASRHPHRHPRLDADAIVLAAAGSSDPRAQADVRAVARDLAAATDRPVLAGYASAAAPRVDQAVEMLRAAGAERVAIAAMLLADGQFYRSLSAAGADVVTRPLGTHPTVVDLILSRYADAQVPAQEAG